MLVAAAAVLIVSLTLVPEAEARRGWRKARWSSGRTTSTYQSWGSTRRSSYWSGSSINRAEQNYWRRRDAWYNEAYNGFKPEDFR